MFDTKELSVDIDDVALDIFFFRIEKICTREKISSLFSDKFSD